MTIIKASTLNRFIKDPEIEKPKVQIYLVTAQRTNDVEISKKAQKKKKKSLWDQKKNQEDFTLATGVNRTDVLRQSYNRPKKSDTAKIKYYYYKNKGHYINKCPKPKNQQWS